MGTSTVVTGVCGGIGAAVAATLLEHGVGVVGVDLHDVDHDQVPWNAPDYIHIVGDVTKPATCDAALSAAGDELTGLVTSAFAEEATALVDTSEAGFAHTFDVLLTSAWRWGVEFAGRRAGRGGAIVHVASVHAFGAVSGFGPYAAAKAGLVALTRSMAVEWAASGIRCNAVAPAFVPTERNSRIWRDAPQLEARTARIPLGQPVQPHQVAAATRFLLSDDAAAITGVCLPVDGGLLARLP